MGSDMDLPGELFGMLLDWMHEHPAERSLAMYVKNSTRDTWELEDGKWNEGDGDGCFAKCPQILEPGKDASLYTKNSGWGNAASGTIIYRNKATGKRVIVCRYQVNDHIANDCYDTGAGEGYISHEGPEVSDELDTWWRDQTKPLRKTAFWRKKYFRYGK